MKHRRLMASVIVCLAAATWTAGQTSAPAPRRLDEPTIQNYAAVRKSVSTPQDAIAAARKAGIDRQTAEQIESLIETVTIERREQAIRDGGDTTMAILRGLAAHPPQAATQPSARPVNQGDDDDDGAIRVGGGRRGSTGNPRLTEQEIKRLEQQLTTVWNVPIEKVPQAIEDIRSGKSIMYAAMRAKGQDTSALEKMEGQMRDVQKQTEGIAGAMAGALMDQNKGMFRCMSESAQELLKEVESAPATQPGAKAAAITIFDDVDPITLANLALVRAHADELGVPSTDQMKGEDPILAELHRRTVKKMMDAGVDKQMEANLRAYLEQWKRTAQSGAAGAGAGKAGGK